ncbi:OTU domain-containing protein 5 isoform X2 [Iris pallida]|uniref:ubiquitinyl hydrolase 1 n=1 Tax=Iris pallida TaxID=29817 RepID=A0AAX6DYG3_IRIPA|nr:OTU domain-containing protein 5 isoform X2 [Iris pallida]KAJ6800846.1 OTU domain-containing protein 5 isoform X2 [Iris pallida]
MTRILVQRGSSSSSSNPSRPPSSLPPQSEVPQEPGGLDEGLEDNSEIRNDVLLPEIAKSDDPTDKEKGSNHGVVDCVRNSGTCGSVSSGCGPSQIVTGGSKPPPPPVPPPKPPASSLGARILVSGCSNAGRVGSPRRQSGWPVVPTRPSPSESRPSSPRSYAEGEGYNSADEQSPCFVSSYDDAEREHMFELEIRRTKGLEVKRMMEDGNCLFRAVADQVYGDPDAYDMARQMCIDYMERERDHFSQFVTEGFTSYCKRKRRDKVYGNNVEIQAFCEMYNRPIHIYCYSTEPINIFHGSYNTDTPPIRLSFHHGNHYNSLVDPRRVTIGAGLGFSSLQERNVDKERVKAAIKAQQDQQIDNALLAEGRFYSDLEITEKEIERMVIEASRAEYLAEDKLKQQIGFRECTSGAEPSSSGTRTGTSSNIPLPEGGREKAPLESVLSSSMQMVLSMGFSYLQVIEAYSIFGDDVDSMVCYLLEMGGSSASLPGSNRLKGKATDRS